MSTLSGVFRYLVTALTAAIVLSVLLHRVYADLGAINFPYNEWKLPGIFLCACFLSLGLLWYLLKRFQSQRAASLLGLAVIAVFSVARFIWLVQTDSFLASDFRSYWACAESLIGELIEGEQQTRSCRGLYLMRSVFYTFPIRAIFGSSNFGFEIVNLLLHILTSFVVLVLFSRLISARAAVVGVFLYQLWPDLWYVVTLTSHDVPGPLWLTLFFLLAAVLIKEIFQVSNARLWSPSMIGLSVVFGLVLTFAEFQRSYGMPLKLTLLATFLFAVLIHFSRRASGESLPGFKKYLAACIFLIVVPFTTLSVGSSLIWKALDREVPIISMTPVLTATDIYGTNRYFEMYRWRYGFYTRLPTEIRDAFAYKKLLHEWTGDPAETFRHLMRKNSVLAGSAGYLKWSRVPIPDGAKPLRLSPYSFKTQQVLCAFASTLVTLFAVLGLLRVRFDPLRPEFVILLFPVVCYMSLWLLGEVQSRYDIFLALPIAFMGASLFSKSDFSFLEALKKSTGYLLVGFICLACLLGSFRFVADTVSKNQLALTDLSDFKSLKKALPELDGIMLSPVIVKNDFRGVAITYPGAEEIVAGTTTGVRQRFNPTSECYKLRFFISSQQVKKEPQPGIAGDIEYVVRVNGKEAARGAINDIALSRFIEYPEDTAICSENLSVKFAIKNNTAFVPPRRRNQVVGVAGFEFLEVVPVARQASE